ncbi:MAG: Baseplate assembly protein [Edwardsiella phage MSW-3]|nr:MAG: Baseplate assembly protein [Edwardsiella phage MSW-3]
MTVRRLDDKGDIVTSGVQFIGSREEIAQTVQTRLRLFLGEYFRDVTDGTPWFENILGKASDLAIKEALLRNRVAQTPGVIRLVQFSFDFDPADPKKTATVKAGILTQYGIDTVTYGTDNTTGV